MKPYITAFCLLLSLQGFSQELYFPPTFGNTWESVSPADLDWCETQVPALNTFMEESNSKGLIILKDGKLAFESYYNGHGTDSLWYWASAGKTLTAFEVGMLKAEGLLTLDDIASDYLGDGWTSCDIEEERQINIHHQLTMTSGLDYSSMIDCTSPECLTCLNIPGSEWFYHNAPYTLLTGVIEDVTGVDRSVNTFNNFGLTAGFSGLWVPIGDANVFFSKTRAMAKFGLMMNARGYWDDVDLLGDSEYYNEMVSPSQEINESYGYLWWLNSGPTHRLPGTTLTFAGKIVPAAPDHLLMALGKDGQILLVDTVENIVVVRMGENPDQSLIPTFYLNELWGELEKLFCSTSSTIKEEELVKISVHPNPAKDIIEIDSNIEVGKYSILDIYGNEILTSVSKSIDVSRLVGGVYILHSKSDTKSYTTTFVKQ